MTKKKQGKNNELAQREKAAVKKKYWLRLTRNCNNQCVFCLDKDAQNKTALLFSDILAELKKGRKNNFEQVILSGGEATIHPEFLAIIKAAKNIGFSHIQVITNGRMFAYNDFLCQAIINGVSEITFSIHGYNAKLHDFQTGVKGSFKQAIAGLKNALKIKGLIVNIDIVVNKLNYKYLPAMLKYFVGLGVFEFDLLQIIPFGRAWDNRQILFEDSKKTIPYWQKAFKEGEKLNLVIWTNRLPPQFLCGFEHLIQHPAKLHDEIRGRRDMFGNFLEHGKKMACFGKRCEYCFLNNFCADLSEFKKQGFLSAKEGPLCLDFSPAASRKIYEKKLDNIYEFLDFYIKSRYFLKSEKCRQCALDDKCGGAPCNFIIKNGFKALKPINNNG